VEARLPPMGVGSVNRGLFVANIESRNTIIPVSCSLGKAGALFGSELKTLMQELNEVLVA